MPESVYEDLRKLGADIDRIKQMKPTQEQLVALRDGLVKLMKERR